MFIKHPKYLNACPVLVWNGTVEDSSWNERHVIRTSISRHSSSTELKTFRITRLSQRECFAGGWTCFNMRQAAFVYTPPSNLAANWTSSCNWNGHIQKLLFMLRPWPSCSYLIHQNFDSLITLSYILIGVYNKLLRIPKRLGTTWSNTRRLVIGLGKIVNMSTDHISNYQQKGGGEGD